MSNQRFISRAMPSIIIALAALIVGLSGNGSRLPLDDHEVLVARTSEEMLQRGDWLTPYFNDVPRTAKPPLAYWATMLVDRLGDNDGLISEWEARVPVIIGGLLWSLATLALGIIVCGRLVGFIGALLLVGSAGFLNYTHSARPELLYAMFCTAGLACFARQWRAVGNQESGSFAWPALGWAMMGLAVLTKGPQLPLIMLIAWAIGMAAAGERRFILRTLRPFSGVLIMAAVSLWWFVLMWQGVEGASDRMGRETVGRIFQVEGKPLTRIVDPYYFYRIVVLLSPWVVWYVLALFSPCIKEIQRTRGVKLLWWISLLTLASLHLTLNRRWYYQLPTMGVLFPLMAWTAIAIGGALIERGRIGWWRAICAAHVIGCFVALVWMWQKKDVSIRPTTLALISMGAISIASLAMIFVRSQAAHAAARPLTIASLCGIALMFFAGDRASPWTMERFHRRDFALEVGRLLPADALLLGWNNDWQQEQYYLHRPIPSFFHRNDLIDAFRGLPRGSDGWLLTSTRKPFDWPPNFTTEAMHRQVVEQGEELTLWRISAR